MDNSCFFFLSISRMENSHEQDATGFSNEHENLEIYTLALLSKHVRGCLLCT